MPRAARHAPSPRPRAAFGRSPASEALVSLRFRRTVEPYGARGAWPITSVKSSSLARDAMFELREKLEEELGERLTQPDVMEFLVAFAVRNREALVSEIVLSRAS